MGHVEKWNISVNQLSGDLSRRVYVYLPSTYACFQTQGYPVLYMFDGQNVFFDSDATYGKSWGMLEYLEQAEKELIVVAVECNQNGNSRLSEYAPFDFSFDPAGDIQGRGEVYMDWLVSTLKPTIDRKYRTIPDRNHTLICGSSMGGLMALYAVTAYNSVFQRAACISPSLWTNPEAVKSFIDCAHIQPDTCVYLDYGSEELNHRRTFMPKIISDVTALLIEKQVNVSLRIVPGGTHCEASWEKQIPFFMDCFDYMEGYI